MDIAMGDRVQDREDPSGVARVVEVLETRADEYEIKGVGTVAEDNPEYPPDDHVVVAVWEKGVKRYHFPESRLLPVRRVSPSDLKPSPLHARQFDPEANVEYIEEVEKWDGVGSVLVAREHNGDLELLEGHKRRWVAEQAGVEAVDVVVEDMTEREAIGKYLDDHCDALDERERHRTLRFLSEYLSSTESDIEEFEMVQKISFSDNDER